MERLSRATCKALPYDPALLDIGIVHLGVGAFHRAHQADYTDEAVRRGDLRWGIMGASLRSAETRDALAPQDFLGLALIALGLAAIDGRLLRAFGRLRLRPAI